MGIIISKKSNLSMMNRISSMLFIVAAVFFCSTSVSAETFKVNGLFYNILNDSEVEVAPAPDVFCYVHDVVIPETVTHEGKTYSVTAVGDKAFKDCYYLNSVKLGNNITELGNSAFDYCVYLKSIKFPKSLKRIEDYAFNGCEKLADVQLSGNVEYMGVNSLGSITYGPIPWFNNQPDGPVYVDKVFLGYKGNCPETVSIKEGTVCIAGRAFDSQKKLVTVNLPSSIKFISVYAFNYSENLANVNFANMENLEYVGLSAFNRTQWVNNLPSGPVYLGKVFFRYNADLPENYTIKNGTVMIADYAFKQYSTDFTLKSVSIPNSVKYIGEEAFTLCGGIKSMVLPEGLKELQLSAFSDCYALESVKLPSTLETLTLSAFANCMSLKQIDLPANLRYIKYGGLGNCSSLIKFTVEPGNRKFCAEDGVLFSKDKKTLIAFPGSRGGTYSVPSSVEKIKDNAFNNCKLKSVTIPASVSEVGTGTFRDSESLESVTFEPGSKVKNLPQYTFYYCQNLKTLVLPDSLEWIDTNNFSACYALENMHFPESLKFIIEFGNKDFKWYENQPDGIVYAGKLAFNIKGSFAGKTLTVKEGTKAINRDFGADLDITEVVLPASLEFIGMNAFPYCGNLTDIKGGPNAITEAKMLAATNWMKKQSSDPAFNGVYILGKNVIDFDESYQNIEIKEGIENLSLGNDDIYRVIRSTKKLVLPASLKYIQEISFRDYIVTDTMTVKNIVPIDITKAEIRPDMYENCVLKVPEESVDAYRNARGWSLFKKIVDEYDSGGVEAVETDDAVRVFVDGGNIVVKGAEEGTTVEVFNLNGQTVYSGVESLINVPARGIYIVRVVGKSYKIIK